jgi:hypothetical protein
MFTVPSNPIFKPNTTILASRSRTFGGTFVSYLTAPAELLHNHLRQLRPDFGDSLSTRHDHGAVLDAENLADEEQLPENQVLDESLRHSNAKDYQA